MAEFKTGSYCAIVAGWFLSWLIIFKAELYWLMVGIPALVIVTMCWICSLIRNHSPTSSLSSSKKILPYKNSEWNVNKSSSENKDL